MLKKRNRIIIIVLLLIFSLISIITIYSARDSKELVSRQLIWYIVGFIIILITKKMSLKKVTNYSVILYVLGNISLLLLLIFGTKINGSKCWFIIPGIGSVQPSEFMKLILIIVNAKVLNDHKKIYTTPAIKSDLILIFKIFVLTLIPSVLTFLQPDTGIVLIYFLISFIMLFVYGIKKSIFIILIVIICILIFSFLLFYFKYQNNFINIFGTSFFYRIDRLLDWSNNSGMQLTNAISAVKSAGVLGFGFNKTPIYIPESHTDFIFSVYSSNTGFVGTMFLLLIIAGFDYILFDTAISSNDNTYKYIIIGFLIMIAYQQIQNISMNIGLLPITGITLPFISYGGSSLLSYILGLTLILNYGGNKKNA